MIRQVWQKRITFQFKLADQDTAYELVPLPYFTSIPIQNYMGMHFEQIREFFSRYAIHPNKREQFWLEIQDTESSAKQIKAQEIALIIYMRYFRKNSSPSIIAHFRRRSSQPIINLSDYYNQNIKASTFIKSKQLKILLVDFTKEEFSNLYSNFKENRYEEFIKGNTSQDVTMESNGFASLMKRVDMVPLRIITEQQNIQRSMDPSTTLLQLQSILFNTNSQKQSNQYTFYLWGVPLSAYSTTLSQLISYCHPDGFLYLFLPI